jgi:uncharacterized membrane protein YciS (DUF1049 family)
MMMMMILVMMILMMMMMMMMTINTNNQCLISYIYLARTERKIEDVLGEDQFEFRR